MNGSTRKINGRNRQDLSLGVVVIPRFHFYPLKVHFTDERGASVEGCLDSDHRS